MCENIQNGERGKCLINNKCYFFGSVDSVEFVHGIRGLAIN